MVVRTTALVVAAVGILSPIVQAQTLTPIEQLGRNLFFDARLSTPPGQSCAACHAPEVGFTGPVSVVNDDTAIYPGAVHVRFGNRKPPAAAYGGDSPNLYFDDVEEVWVGGMFWDGRATGWTLDDPLAEQAMGPFLNPLEQNTPGMRQVVRRVAQSDYADLFEQVWGEGSLDPVHDVYGSYVRIARSIAAYERSPEVNPFTSKYDYFLAGQATLTDQEMMGLTLFEGAAMCSACHLSQPGPNGEPPLFTDFTYDNLGTPANPDNPFYNARRRFNAAGDDWIDPGLGGFLRNAGYDEDVYMSEMGKHKVPTLRNVDLRPNPDFVKAYMHNGVFRSLEEVMHFYNTRDVEVWPDPEVSINVNEDELGNLGLTLEEEAAIVAFMKTLSDGFMP